MSDIEELQRLLLGEKKQLLDSLTTPADRTRLVAEVLASALGRANSQDPRLVQALQKPVTRCIERSVRADTAFFAEALYPALAPAIRKSISETLRQFVQSLNQVIEHSVSIRGLRWRWEAWRSRVPFAEIVLKNTLLYRVEESYLIHRESGLLLAHAATKSAQDGIDQDAVSAMLTAIQDFVNDAFASNRESDLETLDMGERSLWVIRGPQAMMACLIRGIPPRQLRERLTLILDDIHARYADRLKDYSGDQEGLSDLGDLLADTLAEEAKNPSRAKSKPWPALLLLFALLILALVGLWRLNDDSEKLRDQQLLRTLAEEPGVIVLGHQRSDGHLEIQGLRDPLAREPARIAERAGFDDSELRWRFRAFQSLDEPLVLRRIEQMLNAPDGVKTTLSNGVLSLSGAASPQWIDRIRSGIILPVGVDELLIGDLHDDTTRMRRQLTEQLQLPSTIDIELAGRSIFLSGSASLAWLQGLDAQLKKIDWLASCDASGLEIAERKSLQTLLASLDAEPLNFIEGVELEQASSARLASLSAQLIEAQALARRLGDELDIHLKGFSDGTGAKSWNIWLRHQRVDAVMRRLEANGLAMQRVFSSIDQETTSIAIPDPKQRKVTVHVDASIQAAFPSTLCH